VRGRYRDCVCAVVREKVSGRVLLCHRKGYAPSKGWQFPQGGVDPAKDLIKEAKRELREEIGTDSVTLVALSPVVYTYHFPEYAKAGRPGFCGQRQRWILFELDGRPAINFRHKPAEFDDFKWVQPKVALKRIVDFKKDVYLAALRDLHLLQSK
jgi:putative (di)nucleoside polyphosphate hydrolase